MVEKIVFYNGTLKELNSRSAPTQYKFAELPRFVSRISKNMEEVVEELRNFNYNGLVNSRTSFSFGKEISLIVEGTPIKIDRTKQKMPK